MKQRHIRKTKATKSNRKVGANIRHIRSDIRSHNFSDVEDNAKAFQIISNIAADAGANASLEAKAAGLSRAYIRNYQNLVKVSPQGEETMLIPKKTRPSFYIKFKPYTVFHAVKK